MNKIISIVGAIVLLGSVISGYIYFDSLYARASDLNNNEARLTVHIAQDRINFLQQQVWQLEDRCGDLKYMTQDQKARHRAMTTENAYSKLN